ncbi:SLC13 family permease [Desulfovibrio sp. JC010]|uniref:SLC13 family permease n=1 Tax=Desulfovibrio sp. JC010 TaxID=2593641 RepID=UPI0013D56265|nr:SLC13 family permease [Desulfovibrio sp. JC010]NDV26846.1 TRAP transporter large permease subunit [Desulfovibrio sp. JC010]
MTLPPLPDIHALAVLALTAVALILFSRKKTPLETSSLIILLILTVGFELFPYQSGGETFHAVNFFYGFGNEALIAVCALMIAGQGLLRTGSLDPMGRMLARLWKKSPSLSFLLTLLLGAFISAFINNVPVVVLLLPVLISVSLRTGAPASSVLMPMGFSTLLGGTATTIGTSTNLLVVSVAADMGFKRLEMFDFVLPAVIAGSISILYLWQIAPRLIPKIDITLTDRSPRIFTAHLEVTENSPLVGNPLSKAFELTDNAMKVSAIERGEGKPIYLHPGAILQTGDHLVINDTPDQLKEFEKVLHGTLFPVGSNVPIDSKTPLEATDQQIAEIVIYQGSPLKGTTLKKYHFAQRTGMTTLAIHRSGKKLKRYLDKISDIKLKQGDILLVQGARERITELKKNTKVLVLDSTMDLPYSRKVHLALSIMLGIILTAAFGILPIAISAPCGALFMILTGCITWRDATRALNVQVVLIVVTSLALGKAMLITGGADYLGKLFVALSGDAPAALILSGLMLLMAIFTNIISNNATAVIGTPIALSIAQQLNLDPEPFILAVLFGANMSFATPMAYKTNLLVMNAGEYSFADFLRVGTPLVLLMWGVLSVVLPVIYL